MRTRRALTRLASALLATLLVAGGGAVGTAAAYADEPEAEAVTGQIAEPAEVEAVQPAAPEPAVPEPAEPEQSQPAAAVPEAAPPAPAAADAAPAPTASAEVAGATTAGLAVRASLVGASVPAAELHAGAVPAGTAASASEQDLLAAAAEIAQGAPAVAEMSIPQARLQKGGAYEIVFWQGGAAPAAGEVVAVAPLAVSDAQWKAVFPSSSPNAAWNEKAAVGAFEWGIRKSFREYVVGPIAGGKITVTKPASGNGVYKFPQTKNTWDPETQRGTVSYAGKVNFTGHWDDWNQSYALDLDFANPIVNVKSASEAELLVPYDGGTLTIASIDLRPATKTVNKDGSVRFAAARVALTKAGADTYFEGYVQQSYELDPLTFTVGADSGTAKPVDTPKKDKTGKDKKRKAEKPVKKLDSKSRAAGSLAWGVSTSFAAYVVGPIAKGQVSTNGVGRSGGAYLFPQASDGGWNSATQTGTVQFSGVVTFTGHKGLLSESFANPVITVTSASSGTLSAAGRTFGLDLASATKSVGSNGEVTWSGVPVSGGISGGASGGSRYTLPADPLSFTVGAASGVSYGSTAVSNESLKRTPAATPPATAGIRVLTPAEDIVPGGEIEFEAEGFDAKEREILVVLYSDPIVLDEAAGADEGGTVRWIGTLPEGLEPGEHTITLQGSRNAGAVIEVRDGGGRERVEALAIADGEPRAAALLCEGCSSGGRSDIVWWGAAAALLIAASLMGGLVVRQRRSSTGA